ncbi:MAG: elongation factor 4 [Candidatus Omnitrophica bacterium]|nr:elongation factor 4 [Candidatus Omnitrophota bacterium]
MDLSLIRNFCIIAHIDHGKSTLADRMLQMTGSVEVREFRDQVLDSMDLERERGITIKASAVRMKYKAADGKNYVLNLIDTPGHVDFSSEVSKSIAACEGAVLVVDASQGVEAQTVANLNLALQHNLKVIPVLNKVDLLNADVARVTRQLESALLIEPEECLHVSAKEGIGIEQVFERIVRDVPPPVGSADLPLRATIFDSDFDVYKGVVVYFRVFEGIIRPRAKLRFMGTGVTHEIIELGVMEPKMREVDSLGPGEVGYFTANIRDARQIVNGDTVTDDRAPASEALPGFEILNPVVFSSMYPVNPKDFPQLREALEKLHLSDSSLTFEPESSGVLSMGFRCGFLGLLHMEIVQERLEREYDLNLVLTIPSVVYKVRLNTGALVEVDNPSHLPPGGEISEMLEPWVRATMMCPVDSIGAVMELATNRRGAYKSTEYVGEDLVQIVFELPLSEIIIDFYDKLKSVTRGYGSLDYEMIGYHAARLVRLDVMINGEICEALSSVVPQDRAYARGKQLVDKLKELIPRQMFQVALQAAIGNNVIARCNVKALKKNVTAKCYGGDITRKRKLWDKQKEGKKRMKQFGKVQIPQEAFLAALKIEN